MFGAMPVGYCALRFWFYTLTLTLSLKGEGLLDPGLRRDDGLGWLIVFHGLFAALTLRAALKDVQRATGFCHACAGMTAGCLRCSAQCPLVIAPYGFGFPLTLALSPRGRGENFGG